MHPLQPAGAPGGAGVCTGQEGQGVRLLPTSCAAAFAGLLPPCTVPAPPWLGLAAATSGILWLSDASGRRLLPAELLQQPKPSKPTLVGKEALPLGTFSKYTWHITNILQVNQIFDTPEMPLEITRSFIQNRDGTYELFKCPKVEVESIAEMYGRLEKQPILRPLELKTFLIVDKFITEGRRVK